MGQLFDVEEKSDEYVAAMGEELGVRFHALLSEYSDLVWRWQQFNELFGESEKRIDLLNRKAPLFFWLVQDALVDQTLLGITRLTETPGAGRRKNLTVQCLPEFIKRDEDQALRNEIQRQCAELDEKTRFAVVVRNKAIAHFDQAMALRQPASPLPSITRDRIATALGAIGSILCAVEEHFCRRTRSDKIFDMGTGAIALLYALRGDAGWDALEHEAITEGRIAWLVEREKYLPEI